MSDRIQYHYDRVCDERFTTLVIMRGALYERYYPSYDRPDYTMVLSDLSQEEILFAESIGISNRSKI